MSGALRHLRLMARNNAWANDRLLAACEQLSEAEFLAPRTGFFPSLMLTLNHIFEVDRYYLDGLCEAGQGLRVFDAPPIEAASALRSAQAGQDAALIRFCDQLDEADLYREVAFDRGRNGLWTETIDATLLHLFQHQIHHRGQAHAMLAATVVKPPQLDEFFVTFERDPGALPYLDDMD